jgi:hypothetical protein
VASNEKQNTTFSGLAEFQQESMVAVS